MSKSISPDAVRKVMSAVFKKIGIKNIIYKPVIEGLIETSLRGVDSHGIRLFPHYVKAVLCGRINPDPNIHFDITSSTTAVVDADNGFGITAGVVSMQYAIKTAKKFGSGIVVVKNSSHFGAAGIYGLMAANKNMIGFSFTNVDSLVVPFGGKYKYLGTNAFCFTAPMKNESPFCLDMATSTISWNKLMMYRDNNIKLKPGWAFDINGNETLNPQLAVSLTHFGGYKGYNVAVLVEILTSILSGMPFGPNIPKMYPLTERKRNLSHFFMAIDIKRFQSVSKFKMRLSELAAGLRGVATTNRFEEVKIAGDPEKLIFKNRLIDGIPLTSEIITGFNEILNILNLKIDYEK